jgi:hypothetical protein
MTQSLIPATLSTYAEQVKEVLAVGGDPSFLSNPNPNPNNGVMLWDGTIDESAYFGGWEETEAGEAAATTTATTTTTTAYAEQLERAVNAVGGDPSFLLPHSAAASSSSTAEPWDGTVDEAAHFGGWEN